MRRSRVLRLARGGGGVAEQSDEATEAASRSSTPLPLLLLLRLQTGTGGAVAVVDASRVV